MVPFLDVLYIVSGLTIRHNVKILFDTKIQHYRHEKSTLKKTEKKVGKLTDKKNKLDRKVFLCGEAQKNLIELSENYLQDILLAVNAVIDRCEVKFLQNNQMNDTVLRSCRDEYNKERVIRDEQIRKRTENR